MYVYLEFIKKSFQRRYTYNVSSLLSVFSALVKVFIQVSLWTALFNNRIAVKGITFDNMIVYIVINTILSSLTCSNVGKMLAQRVKDGMIAIDLTRPVSLKYYLFSEDIGENLFRTVFNVLPVCLLCIAFYNFNFIYNVPQLILFIISVFNGIVITFYINYIFGLLAFWFKTTWYIQWYADVLFKLFGGIIIPLWFYPKSLYMLSQFLPMRLVSFEPIQIYLGRLSLQQAGNVIVLQIIWIIILLFFEKFVWFKANQRINIQGG